MSPFPGWASYFLTQHDGNDGSQNNMTGMSGIVATLQQHLWPLVGNASNKPDIGSLILLGVFLYLSYKVLMVLYGAVAHLVSSVFALAMYAIIFAVILHTSGICDSGDGARNDLCELGGNIFIWVQDTAKYYFEHIRSRQEQAVFAQ